MRAHSGRAVLHRCFMFRSAWPRTGRFPSRRSHNHRMWPRTSSPASPAATRRSSVTLAMAISALGHAELFHSFRRARALRHGARRHLFSRHRGNPSPVSNSRRRDFVRIRNFQRLRAYRNVRRTYFALFIRNLDFLCARGRRDDQNAAHGTRTCRVRIAAGGIRGCRRRFWRAQRRSL